MKKIIFTVICFFSSILLVNAHTLVKEDLPYYVKIQKAGSEDAKIINVKKIYDKDTLEVVFNTDFNYYDIGDNFTKYDKYNKDNWKYADSSLYFFNTITYLGYIINPTDLNYFLTQVVLWQLCFSMKVTITDEYGNKINDYIVPYNKIYVNAINHHTISSTLKKNYKEEIWTNSMLHYDNGSTVMDNPIIDGLVINTDNRIITIENNEVGQYELYFNKKYHRENYCYSDGVNVYWQNCGGATDIDATINYEVYGKKLNIKEELVGVNKKVGDATLNSKYSLYLDGNLKLEIEDLENIYVKSNSSYVLKDISKNASIKNIADLNFRIEDNDYTLEIQKEVISKNISIDVLDEIKYYMYLKSNNELYEIVDKNTNIITLPYGLYYIVDQEQNYYQELEVYNNLDEYLLIDNEKEIIEEKEEIEENINNEEQLEEISPEIKDEAQLEEEEGIKEKIEDIIEKEEQLEENPLTLDNIYFYLMIFFVSVIILVVFLKEIIKRII